MDASTTRSAAAPLTSRDGPTTPHAASAGDMRAVPTGCHTVVTNLRAYAASPAGVASASASSPNGATERPAQGDAERKRLAALSAALIVKTSKGLVRNAGSIIGKVNGSVFSRVTDPPVGGQASQEVGNGDAD